MKSKMPPSVVEEQRKSHAFERSDSATKDSQLPVSAREAGDESEDTGTSDAPGLSKRLQGPGYGSVTWLNMIPAEDEVNGKRHQHSSTSDLTISTRDISNMHLNKSKTRNNNNKRNTFSPNSNLLCYRLMFKAASMLKWVFKDFTLRHLIWIKLVFLFQSASMTVLYPYLNLHMKALGLNIQEVAVINAVIPVLFIFTPPLAGFLADKLGNFRVLLSILTALGGLVALLLLVIPPGRDMSPYPDTLNWGISCGKPDNRARFQKLMLLGFKKDQCNLKSVESIVNVSFTPGTCGYLCPTRSKVSAKPKFHEYKVVWPNRGGGFGISEIVDIVTLDSEEARMYHEPDVVDDNIFFPMNWTFHLSCDRIRPNDCIFNPIRRAPSRSVYQIEVNDLEETVTGDIPELSFDVKSITPPETGRPVEVPVNCGAKEVVAQVISTMEYDQIEDSGDISAEASETTVQDTRFTGCSLHCLVNIPREQMCTNAETGVTYDPNITFWSYLLVRTTLGVLTAASLMMFEGAVMATIQELGGDYGIQRFVGNFGAIVFAPLGGYLIDINSNYVKTDFSSAIYIYLVLKLMAALMILFIDLDFRPPGERILHNLRKVAKNVEVVMFLVMMMFAGTFWGFIEGFLFWFLDDLGAKKFLMGWTVALGMLTSLPFLVFSGPITDLVGHINVIVLGMIAYFVRLVGYSFLDDPVYVYPYEALEGFTMALMMTSAVTYVAKISEQQTIASVMGIMGALFFGVGKGSGAFFGGILMSFIGARYTFRYFAGNALLCAFIYMMFQCFYVRPKKDHNASFRSHPEEDVGDTSKDSNDALPNNDDGAVVNQGFDKDTTDNGNGSINHVNEIPKPARTFESGPRSLTGGTRV